MKRTRGRRWKAAASEEVIAQRSCVAAEFCGGGRRSWGSGDGTERLSAGLVRTAAPRSSSRTCT